MSEIHPFRSIGEKRYRRGSRRSGFAGWVRLGLLNVLMALLASLAAMATLAHAQGAAPAGPFAGLMKYYPYLNDTSRYRLPMSGGDAFNGRFLQYVVKGSGQKDSTTWALVPLTSGVTGTLPIANGGTNQTSYSNTNGLIIFNGTSLTSISNGTTGQVLTATTGSTPSWGGTTAGDNVKFDTTTASGGVVDITNPVLQEGTNVTFTIVGTDTVRISSTGGAASLGLIRYYNDRSFQYPNDSAELMTGAGILLARDASTAGNNCDSIILGVNADQSTLDTNGTANAYGKTLKVKEAGITATELGPASVVGGLSGDVSDNTIDANDIATSGVGNQEIAANAVTSDKIANAEVSSDDIADDGVKAEDVKSTAKIAAKFFVSSTKGDTATADSAAATLGYVQRLVDNGNNELKYISSYFAYGTLVPPTDSITLSMPIRSGNIHFLFSDSTNQGNDTDRVDCEISVPCDYDLDSISLAYITAYATADSSQCDSVEVWGPDRSNGTNAADSVWHQENTAYASTSLTRVAFAIDEQINAGDRFAVRFKNVLKQDNAFVRIAWVQFVGKER